MIFVFRTSVKNKTQAKQLKSHLDGLIPDSKWNFDLEDCDRILRIDSDENIVSEITDLLNRHQFFCEELE